MVDTVDVIVTDCEVDAVDVCVDETDVVCVDDKEALADDVGVVVAVDSHTWHLFGQNCFTSFVVNCPLPRPRVSLLLQVHNSSTWQSLGSGRLLQRGVVLAVVVAVLVMLEVNVAVPVELPVDDADDDRVDVAVVPVCDIVVVPVVDAELVADVDRELVGVDVAEILADVVAVVVRVDAAEVLAVDVTVDDTVVIRQL